VNHGGGGGYNMEAPPHPTGVALPTTIKAGQRPTRYEYTPEAETPTKCRLSQHPLCGFRLKAIDRPEVMEPLQCEVGHGAVQGADGPCTDLLQEENIKANRRYVGK
jgi:hypothetical protein